MSVLECGLALPHNYRLADLLVFHQRDSQALSERVSADSLEKGILWHGLPACLRLHFAAGQVHVCLTIDGGSGGDVAALSALVERMLGLNQPVAAFEQAYLDHPQLGALIATQRGLRVPQAATPFEALSWAICGQQISLAVAISLRRKLIGLAGHAHSSGLLCYPDASAVAALGEEQLRESGFSQAKAQALLLLSREIVAGNLPLDEWLVQAPDCLISQRLLALRGIGPWTVDYALLRGFARVDGSLHGDVAVRRQLQRLLGSSVRLEQPFVRDWLAPFAPWRALVAAHLWAMPKLAEADGPS